MGVASHKIMDANETQLKGESDGAVWKYAHNDAIFGRVEGGAVGFCKFCVSSSGGRRFGKGPTFFFVDHA